MKKIELLSPAGNMECLISAVQNGADAVYLGGKKFGARKYAQNFDEEEIIKAIKYCHLYGVKIYITVNTICYEKEIKEALSYIEFLYDNHVDALIMQDLGLISLVRQKFPNLEIHASTQMHNHNDEGLSLLKEMGIKRVVLAREMSLDEIKKLKTEIDLEAFIHGALCISYSGCCLFSAMHGKRSGNRGECVGACRLPYKLYENGKKVDTQGDFLLSTKSLCTIENIDKLIESGISSLKIEGRMKSPEYVGYITKLYKSKINDYYQRKNYEVSKEEIKNIKKLYNRELTSGYLFNNSDNDIMNINSSNHIGIHLGKVLSINKNKIKIKLDEDLTQEDGIRFDNDKGMIVNKLYNEKGLLVNKIEKNKIAIIDNKIGLTTAKEVRKTIDVELNKEIRNTKERKIEISFFCKAKTGQKLEITISDEENKITSYGSIIEQSKNSPITQERIKEQLEKLGNTPFISINTTIEMDNNIFISIKELNDLRRDLTNKLIEMREQYSKYQVIKVPLPNQENISKEDKISLSILVRNEEQLKVALDNNIDIIYVTDYQLYKKYKKENIYFRTKRVSNNLIDYKNENLLVTELGAIHKYSKNNNVISDYYLNVVNNYTIKKLKELGVKKVTLSLENDNENIKLLAKESNIELLIYGRIELMILKYCPIKMLIKSNKEKCNLCKENKYYIKDKNNGIYPILSEEKLTHILDCNNINLINNLQEYLNYGIKSFRIELFDEKKEEIEFIINEIRKQYGYKNNK